MPVLENKQMVELTGMVTTENMGMKTHAPKFTAKFLGDSQRVSEVSTMSFDIEPSMVAEIPGSFIIIQHNDVILPEDIAPTPIQILFYLFHSDQVGYFKVKAHLTNFHHDRTSKQGIGNYTFRGNYNTVNTITEQEARFMFAHLFEPTNAIEGKPNV